MRKYCQYGILCVLGESRAGVKGAERLCEDCGYYCAVTSSVEVKSGQDRYGVVVLDYPAC